MTHFLALLWSLGKLYEAIVDELSNRFDLNSGYPLSDQLPTKARVRRAGTVIRSHRAAAKAATRKATKARPATRKAPTARKAKATTTKQRHIIGARRLKQWIGWAGFCVKLESRRRAERADYLSVAKQIEKDEFMQLPIRQLREIAAGLKFCQPSVFKDWPKPRLARSVYDGFKMLT